MLQCLDSRHSDEIHLLAVLLRHTEWKCKGMIGGLLVLCNFMCGRYFRFSSKDSLEVSSSTATGRETPLILMWWIYRTIHLWRFVKGLCLSYIWAWPAPFECDVTTCELKNSTKGSSRAAMKSFMMLGANLQPCHPVQLHSHELKCTHCPKRAGQTFSLHSVVQNSDVSMEPIWNKKKQSGNWEHCLGAFYNSIAVDKIFNTLTEKCTA